MSENKPVPRKINWTTVAAVVAAVTGVIALILTTLTYFYNPYKLKAVGKYTFLNFPSGLVGITGEHIDSVKRQVQPRLTPTPPSTSTPSPTPNTDAHLEQLAKLVEYRHNFLCDLQNNGQKEVKDIKLVFPGSGFYEIIRRDLPVKTETFLGEIPIGALSPTETISLLIWTNNDRARDNQKAIRFIYPDGAVNVDFEQREQSTILALPLVLLVAATIFLASVALLRIRYPKIERNSPLVKKE